jgi:hypothetical protein
MPEHSNYADYELNYLYETNSASESEDDIGLWAGLAALRSELREPFKPDVVAQYDESFALFNRMRQQLGRYEIQPPRFDRQAYQLSAPSEVITRAALQTFTPT